MLRVWGESLPYTGSDRASTKDKKAGICYIATLCNM